jgi:hydrogenase-4 component B
MGLFVLAMILVVCSTNMFSFIFFWEIMSISSLFLVLTEYENPKTRKAGIFYFVMTQLSTVFLISGFLSIANTTGSLEISSVTPAISWFALCCLLIGFSIKAGVIPFHKWLPYAHPESPSNISALMSGVMIKVAIYGLIRFFILARPSLGWGIAVLILGSISAILGVIYALKEHDIKRLLAYHSIENIGIILLGFGLYLIFSCYNLADLATLALLGSLFHVVNHAIFKTLLFLSAGSVVNQVGSRNIEEMGGLVKTMPYTSVLFLIGSVAISALPPLNGFVSEMMIFSSFFSAIQVLEPSLKMLAIICLSLFALTSALAAACFVKVFAITFLAVPRSKHASEAQEVPKLMIFGQALLAILCIALGVFSYQIFAYLGYNLPLINLVPISIFLAVLFIIALLIMATSRYRQAETWGCGFTDQNPRMEYTASGFSEPILTIFKVIYSTKKKVAKNYHDSSSIILKDGSAEITLLKFFDEYIYMPIARFVQNASDRIAGLQNSNLDTYMGYVLVAIILSIVYIGWFA